MSSTPRPEPGRIRLPIWAGAFVALTCFSILGLSGWGEWSARDAALKNAEVDMANLAQSLAQHASDTFELTENALSGMVHRLQIDGAGSEAIARLQTFIDLRKPSMGRIRALFIYGENGHWLATTEAVSLQGRDNSDRDYFRHHAQSEDRGLLIGEPIKAGPADSGSSPPRCASTIRTADLRASWPPLLTRHISCSFSTDSTSAKAARLHC